MIKCEMKEIQIEISLNLDEQSGIEIDIGIGFLNYMLNLFVKYGCFGLVVKCYGDFDVDLYYIIEDMGIVFGECFKQVLGDKQGIEWYGMEFVLMDEILGQVSVDLSGWLYLVFDVEFMNLWFGGLDMEIVEDFF